MADESNVWRSHPWVVTLCEDTLSRGKFLDERAAELAVERLEKGDNPRDVFGWSRSELSPSVIRSVEWVPSRDTVLVKRGWWRDPWRLPLPDSEAVFRRWAELIPNGTEREARLGPNDLAMDPRVAGGVIIALFGLIALIGGALEGAGPAPVRGRFIAVIGEEIGAIPAMIIGVVSLALGVGALIWWYVRRPLKRVVSRTR